MGDPPIDNVCAEAVVNFLQGRGALSATWLLKYRVLSGLYRFAIGRGYLDKSQLPMATPKLPLQQTPYVDSNDELRRLLTATTSLHVAHSPLLTPMYRALLLLLYGSGLRIGEALRPDLARCRP
jgi:integrase